MTNHFRSVDVSILGAGVVGLSLAWELSRRGKRVRVFSSPDKKPASWAGAGILPPASKRNVEDPYEQLKRLSHELHKDWSEQLCQQTGINNGFSRCGGLYLATTQAEAATLVANRYWWEEHEIESQQLTADQVVALEHGLEPIRSKIRDAWLLPDECQLRNPRHLKALRAAVVALGGDICEDKPVDRINMRDDQVDSLSCGGGVYRSEQYCICSGAWSRFAMQEVGLENGIMPIRGQMILYRFPASPLTRIVNEGNRYLVARDDGHLLAGSVEEEAGYVCETTEQSLAQIHRWACSILPSLTDVTIVNQWAGLRPGSFDSFPYIGRAGQAANLFVATGHFRSGLHLSPGTAVVLADLMSGNEPPVDLTPFRPSRG